MGKSLWPTTYCDEASFNKGDPTVFDFDEFNTGTYETIKPYLCTFELAQFLSQKLKLNCASGFDGLSAYHIIFAHEILLLHISMFFNLCLVHYYVPNLCSYSMLTPITKSKHDHVTAISNYRPIALATIFSKFLELFILHMIKEFLVSVDNNQFDFKSSHSTDMCRYRYTSQKNISPKIICQKNISLKVLFPELTFVRNHTCQNEHLPEITSARMNTCLKLHLPE